MLIREPGDLPARNRAFKAQINVHTEGVGT